MGYYEFPHTRNYDSDLGFLIKKYYDLGKDYNTLVDIYNIVKQNIKDITIQQLQEWLDDGTLENLISAMGRIVRVFDTVEEMIAYPSAINGNLFLCLGYYSINDCGNGLYKVRNVEDRDSDNPLLIIKNDLVYELIYNEPIPLIKLGFKEYDDIYETVQYCINNNINVLIDSVYKCSQTLVINNHYILQGIDENSLLSFPINTNGIEVKGYYNIIKNLRLLNEGMNVGTVGIHQNYTVIDDIFDCENIYDNVEVSRFDSAILVNEHSRSCIFNKIKTTSYNGTYGINCVGTDNFFTDCIITFNKIGLTLYNNNHAENIKCFYSSQNAIQLTGSGSVINNVIIQQFNNGVYIVGDNNIITGLKGNYVGYGGNGNFIANAGASNVIIATINNDEYSSGSGLLNLIYTNINYNKTNNHVMITTKNKGNTQDIPPIATIGYVYLKNNVIEIDDVNYQRKKYSIGEVTNNLFISNVFAKIELELQYVIGGIGYRINSYHNLASTIRIINNFYMTNEICGYKSFTPTYAEGGRTLVEADTSTTYRDGTVYGYLVD